MAGTAGASGSQTTFNNGRAVIEAAQQVREQLLDLASDALEADRGDLELADGAVQVKGSPERQVPIKELAATAHGGKLLLGRGSSTPVEAPECDASTCVGRLGMESFLAPTFITHALRCRVDRETGVVRVLEAVAVHDCGVILNPIGAEGQVEGGVVMGIGEALLEGSVLSAEGSQLNPGLLDYKLQTCSDAPPITIAFVDAPDLLRGWAERLEGRRRAALRPDAGGRRQRDREGDRPPRHDASDDARPRVVGDHRGRRVSTYIAPESLDDVLAAVAGGARPIAGGTDLVVGARNGKAPLPECAVRDPPRARAGRHPLERPAAASCSAPS